MCAGVLCACCDVLRQGRRPYMEDRFLVAGKLNGELSVVVGMCTSVRVRMWLCVGGGGSARHSVLWVYVFHLRNKRSCVGVAGGACDQGIDPK